MWGRKGFGAPQIWCLTAVMLATMESRLRWSGSVLGPCWAYVGPMLGYSDGWVGLCWARYSHICGAQMSGFWCTNLVSDGGHVGAYWAMILETRFILATQMHRNVHIYIYIYVCVYIYIYISRYLNIMW